MNRTLLSRLAASRMRSKAGDTLSQLCVWRVPLRTAFPLAPPLPSIASAAAEAALFGDFAGTMGRSDFPWTFIIGLRVRPSRCGPSPRCGSGRPEDLPVPAQMASVRARGLRPRRVGVVLALAPHSILPSAFLHSVGTPDGQLFAAQYSARTFPCQRFADTLTDAAA